MVGVEVVVVEVTMEGEWCAANEIADEEKK
jgi:hypothetical protein